MTIRRIPTTVRAQEAPRGLAVPVRIGVDGRIGVVEGREQARGLLRRALTDCANANGFRQGRGIPPRSVFRLADEVAAGVLRADVERVFADLRDRFVLLGVTIQPPDPFAAPVDAGRLVAEVSYRDRLTDDADRVNVSLRSQ